LKKEEKHKIALLLVAENKSKQINKKDLTND